MLAGVVSAKVEPSCAGSAAPPPSSCASDNAASSPTAADAVRSLPKVTASHLIGYGKKSYKNLAETAIEN